MYQVGKFLNYIGLSVVLSLLLACGGGGGGGGVGSESEDSSNNASLSALTISAGSLSPAFDADQLSYSAGVDATETETTVTATTADSAISGLTINGEPASSGAASAAISLAEGDNTITVEVTAENGTTTKTYTITVNRGAVVNNHSPQRVVFIADRDTGDVFELYSVLDDGVATPVKISGAMVENGDVDKFSISPDSTHVAYLADQDESGTFELYVGPVDGSSAAVKVVPNPSRRHMVSFAWSPDSLQLLYLGDFNARDADELFIVDRDGNNAQVINGGIGGSVEIGDYAWSPDGVHVAYKVYNRDNPGEVIGVNSHLVGTVSGDAGFSVRISATLAPPKSIESFAWSPDSTTVAYLADQDDLGTREIYIAIPGVNGPTSKLSAFETAGESVSSYAWSPDSTYLSYVSDSASNSTLYRSTADGASIGSRRSQDNNNLHISSFAWSPDSSKIAYRARVNASQPGTAYELFWSNPADPMDNGTSFSGPLTAGGNVKRYQWSPDGFMITYLADQDTNDLFELYVSSTDGSITGAKRSGALAAGGNVEAFAWSPDSTQLAFRAEADTAGISALFTSLADGSRIGTRVSRSSVPAGTDVGVFSFDWASDSEAITYHGAETAEGQLELYTGLANGHIKGYLVAGNSTRPDYAYNDDYLSRRTNHDNITDLFRDNSWLSASGVELCGMAYYEKTDSMFISLCVQGNSDRVSILRYSFDTDEFDEVYRFPGQNSYGLRLFGDDLFIVRTYDESILRLTGLDRPNLIFVDDYLSDQTLTGMKEKVDIANFNDDFYLVSGNFFGSDQHNGIHILQKPNYLSITELVGDATTGWPNESVIFNRSIVTVTNGPDTDFVVSTGLNGNIERWSSAGVLINQVSGFGNHYLQTDSGNRIYTVFSNLGNSSVYRWASDLSNQETFNFTSILNSGENTRFILRETPTDIEVYTADFRDNDLRIDMTSVSQ